jgi:protein ImuB
VHCHRLARGLDPRPPVRRAPPEELAVEVELDPPVDRVDAAAFAARGLAERLHRTLASHGLSCTRLGVAARTVGGEELHRIWRCAEPLTPAGTVDRVRWQLDAWLTRRRRSGDLPEEADGAVARLRLVPEETVTAGALQMGLWGDVGEADERAGRALVRVQALLGPESVVTAVLVGGRDPAEQVRFVPWGDARDADATPVSHERHSRRIGLDESAVRAAGEVQTWASSGPTVAPAGWPEDVVRRTGRVSAADLPEAERMRTTNRRRRVPVPRRPTGRATPREPPPSWPGRLPAPSPATVPPQPLPAELLAADGSPVLLGAPDLLLGLPAFLVIDGGEPRQVQGWAGPWPVRQRWWAAGSAEASRLQVSLHDGEALLLLFREGRWWVIGEYD